MRYLSIIEVLEIHDQIISGSGGSRGIRDIKALESAISQPRVTFNQKDLYPDIVSKASSLCFAVVMNHPFVDGNKRVGHAAMEIFLILNRRRPAVGAKPFLHLMCNPSSGESPGL
ncbi:MAG: type II toxin-antitoxin system death-on-curing family toxin [Candidatus Desulfacyla sp.]|jgi:death on curing protein